MLVGLLLICAWGLQKVQGKMQILTKLCVVSKSFCSKISLRFNLIFLEFYECTLVQSPSGESSCTAVLQKRESPNGSVAARALDVS